MIDHTNITLQKILTTKSGIEIVNEICIESDKDPLFCQFPEDLKLKSIIDVYAGTARTSGASGTAVPIR